jgi:hypothetical protein
MSSRSLRVPVLLVVLSGVVMLVLAAPAGAVLRGKPPTPPPAVRSDSNTQLVLSSLGPGKGVSGFIANASNPFNPVRDGYPASNPTSGFTAKNEDFAGVIHARPPGSTAEESLYCIDIDTNTYLGYGYALGTWNAANVPNVGYVARLLNEYYPTTDEPAGLTNLDQKAAAVQAAIWFFSDRYVLNTSDPLHDAVAAIVEHIRFAGPLVEPPPPTLAITPAHASGPAGSVLGPFTVTTNNLGRRRRRLRGATSATVTATGGIMFSDPAGMNQIPNGATVPSGQRIWVSSMGPSVAVLQATAQATVPTGNVYLYDGNSGANDAQKLILAHTATLSTIVQATADFLPAGSLIVTKTIAGPAARSQGQVVIHVDCDDGVTRPDFVIPAGAPAGTTSHTYAGIPQGTTCTVIETSNGSVVGTDVLVTGNGQEVTIPTTVRITDTYHFVGSLLVRKTIGGPGAGQQGAVTIHTVCNGLALTPDFVIPAGVPAGDQTKQYDKIPAPATCTVTETADGHNSSVSVVVGGSGQTVPVTPGAIAEADVTDTYGLLPGQLQVTKTIAGTLAGQQGAVTIQTVCNGTALTPDFVIPAGTPAGDHSTIYSDIPTPASCVVTETADGHTNAVPVTVTGSPQTSNIPPGGSGAVDINDTYGLAPGSLLITKTIAGRLAGRQGPVTIHVVCNGAALSPDFVIAAGAPAGNVSQSYDSIPAGSVCNVTETADGATTTVAAVVSGNDQTVTVPAGKVLPVSLTDVYLRAPSFAEEAFQRARGRLKVTKTITGPAARRHGPIAILVACGGPVHAFAFLIPARTGPGSVSRTYAGLRTGSRCIVTETANGQTGTVTVASPRKRRIVTIPANGTATVRFTDRFSPKASSVAPITGGRG